MRGDVECVAVAGGVGLVFDGEVAGQSFEPLAAHAAQDVGVGDWLCAGGDAGQFAGAGRVGCGWVVVEVEAGGVVAA